MIIFGTKGVTSTKSSGTFHCPHCRGHQSYRLRSARRFFTLYFIPLIPLDELGQFVECDACQNTYRPEVLDFDPTQEARAFEAEYHLAIRKAMIHMMLADGYCDPDEVLVISRVYEQLTGEALEIPAIQAEAKASSGGVEALYNALAPFSGHLNDRGKEMVITALFLVATADGSFDEAERALLGHAGQILQMSPAHVRAVIQELVQPRGQALKAS